MKMLHVLRFLSSCVVISVFCLSVDVKGQGDPIFLTRWSSETADTIGLTDGESADIYDSDFSLIQSFTLPPIPSSSQIAFQASVWSPDLNYVHRVVLYDDTYTGPSPNKALLQVWRVDSQQLVFEYLGLSIQAGVIWNQQSTRFAFAIPTGLSSDNLLIFDTAGNQIAELTPPISGLIDRIAWNSDGSLIAFNATNDLHIWNFALTQYLPSPTDSFRFEAPLHFSTISNQIAYVEYIDSLDSEAIIIWDTDTSQEAGQLLGHQGTIYTFDWKSHRIASVGLDETVRIWDSQAIQQVAEYQRDFITQVQLSPDANMLLTNGPDTSTFQTIDPLTGQILSTDYTQVVRNFSLVNEDTSEVISSLNNEDSVDLAALPTLNLTIRANTNPSTAGSVVFDLNGASSVDDSVPYEFTNWTPTPGQYTLTATPYSEAGGTGTAGIPLTINFTVVDSSTACDSTIHASDTAALVNGLPSITGDITINGNGATITRDLKETYAFHLCLYMLEINLLAHSCKNAGL